MVIVKFDKFNNGLYLKYDVVIFQYLRLFDIKCVDRNIFVLGLMYN